MSAIQNVINLKPNRLSGIDVATMTKEERNTVMDMAARLLEFTPGTKLCSPETVKAYLRNKYAYAEQEIFVALFLDSHNQLISCEELFKGTIDGASIYPREVVKATLMHNAAAVVFAHNHPSGNVDPSRADISITERLKTALDLIDVRLLDHIIVGREGTTSLAELGRL